VPTAVRWRLAGQLDRQPDDLVALSALGIAALAALEPGAELEARHDITQSMGRKGGGRLRRVPNGDSPT
jgi:hypothetical protein